MQRTWRERAPAALVFLGLLGFFLLSAPGRGHYLTNDDHGFQLCLGLQVLHGKTPGVDTFNAYGPLVMYVSALGQWLSPSLLGETVLCAVFWALALTLLFAVTARHASVFAGLVAAGAGLALMARFYKWYLWLWPLAALWALDRVLNGRRPAERGGTLVLGLVLGLGWLHRPDVGSLCAVASLLLLLLYRPEGIGRLVLGAALPVALWLVFLLVHDGPHAPAYYFRSTFMGAWMAKTGMGTSFPRFDPSAPLGPGSARILAYALLALAYAGWIVSGVRRRLAGNGDGRARFLVAAACIGLAVVHQALHRKDGQHLLQVLAPALAGGVVWAAGVVGSLRGPGPKAPVLARCALLVLALAVGVSIARWGRTDLSAPEPWPAGRYRALANPLRGADRNALLRPIVRLRELADEDESVLFFPLWPQAYVFAGRRMSGMQHGYYNGLFDASPWADDNLAAIQADPPAVLAVTPDFLGRPGPNAERYSRYRRSHARLDDWLHAEYTRSLYDDGRIVLLGRGGAEAVR